jgi:hypothetical protein
MFRHTIGTLRSRQFAKLVEYEKNSGDSCTYTTDEEIEESKNLASNLVSRRFSSSSLFPSEIHQVKRNHLLSLPILVSFHMDSLTAPSSSSRK